MTTRDMIGIALGNLYRMKLRAFLTTAGVVIAIATFVAMLSFGAGMQANVAEQFNQLGLFTTMHVYPQRDSDSTSEGERPALNAESVERLAQLPGVDFAYPYESFTIELTIKDTTVTVEAQAVSVQAVSTRLFSKISAGHRFDSDSSHEVIISDEFIKEYSLGSKDSLIGSSVTISVYQASFDSAFANVIEGAGKQVGEWVRDIEWDSLSYDRYRKEKMNTVLGSTAQRFIDGYFNRKQVVSDSFTVVGILDAGEGGRARAKPVLVPAGPASRLSGAGPLSSDPMQLFNQLLSGQIFNTTAADSSAKTYPSVTLNLTELANTAALTDSVKAMGFRPFSYAEEFKEIRRFFFYFDMGLAVVGLIALITASLGIVNTLVMSIIERRREIGILKSLGADDIHIRLLFLTESAVIGSVGAAAGILFGWLISRITSFIIRQIMIRQGIDPLELFAVPAWLILLAFLFGLTVALIAGSYPAARAARVDPVDALRND